MKALFVIDMQNDFIDGVLGNPEAQAIVSKVVEKIMNTEDNDIIIFTMDTHYNNYLINTEEGKHLPIPHCIYGTKGWKINSNVMEASFYKEKNIKKIFNKSTFGYIWDIKKLTDCLYNVKSKNTELEITYAHPNDITEIEIIGLDTDFCVLANAMTLKAAFPNVPITIDAACCAGSTPEWHEKALDMLEHCHFNIINRTKGE